MNSESGARTYIRGWMRNLSSMWGWMLRDESGKYEAECLRLCVVYVLSLISCEICHTCSLAIIFFCCFLPGLTFVPSYCLMKRVKNSRTHIFHCVGERNREVVLVESKSVMKVRRNYWRETWGRNMIKSKWIFKHISMTMSSRLISHLKELGLCVCDTHQLTWNLSSLPFLPKHPFLALLDKSRIEH